MSNPLTVSQQIAEQYGMPPARKKRAKRDNDLFDLMDGDGQHTLMNGADLTTDVYDADLPDSIPESSMFSGQGGLGQSLEFSNTAFNADAMDTDPLRMSGTMLGTSSMFPAPTANLFEPSIKFDPGLSTSSQSQFFASNQHGGSQFDDPNVQTLQMIQNSVLQSMRSGESQMDSSSFSNLSVPHTPAGVGGPSSFHLSVLTILPNESSIPHDRNLLLEPKQGVLEIRASLDSLRQQQQTALSRSDVAAMHQLAAQQTELSRKLDFVRQQLERLRSHILLLPLEISLLNQLYLEVSIQSKQLQVFQVELQNVMQGRSSHSFIVPGALVITQQPFPKSVKQNKAVDDGIHVRLLSGAACSIWPTEPVTATIVADAVNVPATTASGRPKKVSSAAAANAAHMFTALNAQKEMDNNMAIFDQITFPQGSRKKTLNLKFSVLVNCSNGSETYTCTLESELSAPFIVKTNENQWEESEGSLLKAEAFGPRSDIPWFQFCNSLQRRYLMATKQDALKPIRPLTSQDLNYLFAVKFGSGTTVIPNEHTMISSKAYDGFWAWFGPGLHKIRYQRHLCTLWQQGLVCGFLQRDEAIKVLTGAPAGSFLIRLSERCPGQFALAYIAYEHGALAVCHYLIKPDDVFGPKKTLPDFLGQSKTLSYITQVVPDSEGGNRVFRLCDKDNTLQEYYSKRLNEGSKGPNPYDEVIRS